MVSTTDFDSVSLGSSPSSPTNLTNMEEIEKINIINKRLRQKEARADWKWVNDGKQFGWTRKRIERIDIRLRKISRKVFRNMSPGTIFHAHHVYSMMEVYARKDY